MEVELGDLEQQVAPGHPAASVHGLLARPDAVDPVEAAGQHQPLEDRPRDVGAVEEVGQRDVGAALARLDDAGDLGPLMPLDVGEGEPDRVRGASVGAASARSTTYDDALALTSSPSTPTPSWRASSRIRRLGYMPGSWVSTPDRKWAGQCALSHADW